MPDSPLHTLHEERDASFTDFGGWRMPVEFDSIREEHAAVREAAGIFDVSHMGEIEVSGPDATELMQRLTTNDVTDIEPGDAQYAAITDDEGIMLDDTVVYRLPDGTAAGEAVDTVAGRTEPLAASEGDRAYLFVPNAGHNEAMYDRWVGYRDDHDLEADVVDTTREWAMVAVQGPEAESLVGAVIDEGAGSAAESVAGLSRFTATAATIAGVPCWIARTGYTGEDGFEILSPAGDAAAVWEAFDVQPCGLGARDTLRIEMGFLLSGQDFDPDDEPRTPFEAGIDFVVDLDTAFVGRDALAAQRESGIDETFTGVKLLERGVPREGYAVTDGDLARIGHLTSGTMSPTLEEPIGLGYLVSEHAEDSERVSVVIRGSEKDAVVVTPPFLDR